jgi:hypothetical protein
MSDSTSGLEPVAVFAALASPLRWQILQMLKSGEALTASQVATVVERDFDGISKHLRVMRAAGVLESQPGPTGETHIISSRRNFAASRGLWILACAGFRCRKRRGFFSSPVGDSTIAKHGRA